MIVETINILVGPADILSHWKDTSFATITIIVITFINY